MCDLFDDLTVDSGVFRMLSYCFVNLVQIIGFGNFDIFGLPCRMLHEEFQCGKAIIELSFYLPLLIRCRDEAAHLCPGFFISNLVEVV